MAALFLAVCQANYIRDVHGAPSSSSELTGLAVQ
ncbi:lysis protein [Salmonella enterica]|nr:lysis protein [Salmonella enterica]EJC8750065.1 colicin release lysis protein [Salmonella enterica]HCM1651985.1 colicin release lysis protein [Salmonella enterica subsp. diarizonae serovar 48:i:z35]